MRLCKYTKVPQGEDRCTKVICVGDVQFFLSDAFIAYDHYSLHDTNFVW